jgi:hypothetical protein
MELTLDQLRKLPIKQLKQILKGLVNDKNPKPETNIQISIIKGIIEYKKKDGLITHPAFVKTDKGMVRESRAKPKHLDV